MELAICYAITIGGASALGLLTRQLFRYRFISDRDSIEIDDLKTGDIILFCHSSGRMINSIVGMEFSHMGILYRDENSNELFCIEHTTNGDYHLSNDKPNIYHFHERYAKYNGYFCIRRCLYPQYFKNIIIILKKIIDYDKVDFDSNFVMTYLKNLILPKSFSGKIKLNENGRYELCCSDFVYMLLVLIGIMDFDEDSYNNSFYYLSYGDINGMYDMTIYDVEDTVYSRKLFLNNKKSE